LVGSGSALDAAALLLLRNDRGLGGRWRIRVLSQRRHLCSFHIPASSSCVTHFGICVSFLSFFFPGALLLYCFPWKVVWGGSMLSVSCGRSENLVSRKEDCVFLWAFERRENL
jgi:hypothetical protein